MKNPLPMIRVTFFLLVATFMPASLAGPLPQFYQSFSPPAEVGEQLDYLIVEINDEGRMVKSGHTLAFVRGDRIRVRKVALKQPTIKVREVNVVGFRSSKSNKQRDDFDEVIDTSEYLTSRKWAVDKAGRTYAIVVASKLTLHGLVYLQRIEPELRYVDITVNDKSRVMREGESLLVRASDMFKVKNVVTNLKDHKHVHFQIVVNKEPGKTYSHLKEAEYYDILFSHRAYVFAKIPLVVEKLSTTSP